MRSTTFLATRLTALSLVLGASFTPATFAAKSFNPDQPSPKLRVSDPAAFICNDPVLTVAEDRALFAVYCHGADHFTIKPTVTIAGEVSTRGQAPYLINATYVLEDQAMAVRAAPSAAPQVASGTIRTSAETLPQLSRLFEEQLAWDAENNLLSVQERTGKWRVYGLDRLRSDNAPVFEDMGLVSAPVRAGKTFSHIAFDHKLSRSAPKGASTPEVLAKVVVHKGALQVQEADTIAANRRLIQEAIDKLDRKGHDMQRAWALAAPARYLNLRDEVLYAERKVAAFNPHLLEQFQADVQRILPLSLPH